MSQLSERDIRYLQREKQAMERERDKVLQELSELQKKESTEGATAVTPSVTSRQPVVEQFLRNTPQTLVTENPANTAGVGNPAYTAGTENPANPAGVGNPAYTAGAENPANTAGARDPIGPIMDPGLDTPLTEVQPSEDTIDPAHTVGATVQLETKGDGIPDSLLSDRKSADHGINKIDLSLRDEGEDDDISLFGADTSTPRKPGKYNPAPDFSFSAGGEDDAEGEELRLSFAGQPCFDIPGDRVAREEEKTMKMLSDLLAQSRALNQSDSGVLQNKERDRLSKVEHKSMDNELEEKMAMERIRALLHEEKLMQDRKAKKEMEIEKVENRLVQLRENEIRFEEALRQKQKKEMEEQKKRERLKFIKEQERKLRDNLIMEYNAEKQYDAMLENMHREERQRLANMQLKQQAFERQMSSRIKAEHNEDIESQIRVKRDINQREIVSNRDTSQEMRQSRIEYPHDIRVKQEKKVLNRER